MKKEYIFSFVFIICFWQISALVVNNDIFVPTPISVLMEMFRQLQSPSFFIIISNTLFKTFVVFIVAIVLAMSLGLLAGAIPKLEKLLMPFNILMTSIPNISYIIILLLCFGSNRAIYYIIFFIIFPILYNATVNGIKSMDSDLKDVLRLYNERLLLKIRKIYFYQALPYVKGSAFSTLTLALKVCIMSEVLGQVKYGIGREMYVNKINLDMTGVFSWTIWVIIIVFVIEKGLRYIFKKFDN